MPQAAPSLSTVPKPRISVCICTYKRNPQLALLLADLAQQTLPPCQIVVVDNEANGAAQMLVQGIAAQHPVPMLYEVQPEKNIALTRNRSVALATGQWLAFLDDDERVAPDWLALMLNTAQSYAADGVLGRVNYLLPTNAPPWMHKHDFYTRRLRQATGALVPTHRMGIGNSLIRADFIHAQPGPFNPRYGLTGGEDSDLMGRIVEAGGRIVWCDEAVADEPLEPNRATLNWLLMRSLRGGQDHAYNTLAGRYGMQNTRSKAQFFATAAAKATVSALLAPPSLLAGKHTSAKWLISLYANIGKLSAFAGFHYREYQ